MPVILHPSQYSGIPLKILQDACPAGFTVKTLEEATQARLVVNSLEADYLLN